MEAYIKEATSVYAALLSTLLAIRAIYINRLRVYADLHIDEDYRLYISNLSPAPIIVTDYQFLWDNTPNNFNKYDIDYGGYTLILPNNYSIITLSENNKFPFRANAKLYVKISIKGKHRPIKRRIK